MKKHIPTILAAAFLFFLCGCENVRDGFKSSWKDKTDPVYQVRNVQSEQAAVYNAALIAGKNTGFTYVSGGAAQGRLEMRGNIAQQDNFSGARQRTLKVRLSADIPNGGTKIEALISEVTTEEISGSLSQTNERSLRDNALYEAFFNGIGDVLGIPAKRAGFRAR